MPHSCLMIHSALSQMFPAASQFGFELAMYRGQTWAPAVPTLAGPCWGLQALLTWPIRVAFSFLIKKKKIRFTYVFFLCLHPSIHTQGGLSTRMLPHADVSSSQGTCRLWGQNWGCQAWQQVSLSTELSPQPQSCFELGYSTMFFFPNDGWETKKTIIMPSAILGTDFKSWLRLVATSAQSTGALWAAPWHVWIEQLQLSLIQDLSCLADTSERQRTVFRGNCTDLTFT